MQPKHEYLDTFDKSALNSTQPIFIVGMHNSGTSILSELLHESGVHMGNSMGHFESRFFSILINNELLLGGGDRWSTLPLKSEKELLNKWILFKALVDNWHVDYMQWGYDGHSKWGIKDPRLCITLPLYLRVFPDAKVIYLERDIDDVSASLCKREKADIGIKNNFSFWKDLASAYAKSFKCYEYRVNNLYKLSYEKFCNEPYDESRKLFQFLKISENSINKKVLEKVSPKNIGSYMRRQADIDTREIDGRQLSVNETVLPKDESNLHKVKLQAKNKQYRNLKIKYLNQAEKLNNIKVELNNIKHKLKEQ